MTLASSAVSLGACRAQPRAVAGHSLGNWPERGRDHHAPVLSSVGLLVARRRPRNSIGWILLAFTFAVLVSVERGQLRRARATASTTRCRSAGSRSFARARRGCPVLVLAPLPIVLFPDGQHPARAMAVDVLGVHRPRRRLPGRDRHGELRGVHRAPRRDRPVGVALGVDGARARSRRGPQHGDDRRVRRRASPRWSRTRSSTSAARPETSASS